MPRIVDCVSDLDTEIYETGEKVPEYLDWVEWAHAYLGAEALVPAFRRAATSCSEAASPTAPETVLEEWAD